MALLPKLSAERPLFALFVPTGLVPRLSDLENQANIVIYENRVIAGLVPATQDH
jgi:hypothetical protein